MINYIMRQFGKGMDGGLPLKHEPLILPPPEEPFQKYGKTHRLFRDIIVTEKLDGANSLIRIDGSDIRAGSRNQWLDEKNTNYGFYIWVMNNRKTLIKDLGDGLHRGEWYGQKINRKYGLDHKRFALFNTEKWGKVEFATPQLEVVPVLYKGMFSEQQIKLALDKLTNHGSIAVPGYMNPEGVCVYHTQANLIFKATIKNDQQGKEHKDG